MKRSLLDYCHELFMQLQLFEDTQMATANAPMAQLDDSISYLTGFKKAAALNRVRDPVMCHSRCSEIYSGAHNKLLYARSRWLLIMLRVILASHP